MATNLEVYVSNLDELMEALENASGGETIKLAGGDYGDLYIYDGKGVDFKYDVPVTITSADVDNPAEFSTIFAKNVSGLTFDSVVIDYESEAGAHEAKRVARFDTAENVTIRNSTFLGDIAHGVSEEEDGFATGVGLAFADSVNITVENNEFSGLHRAGVFSRTDGLEVIGNDIHNLRSDGINFSDVSDVLIEGNYLHDFAAATETGDHRDMIQFWTTNNLEPSTDIVIRGNILDSNGGDWTQSIYIQNEEVTRGAGYEMYYQNILIEDNVIRNAQANGIYVGATDGLIIQNNTIVHNATTGDANSVNVPAINIADEVMNAEIINNVSPRIIIHTEDATVENNLLIQREDKDGDNYYGDLFVDGLSDGGDVLADLFAAPDGAIAATGIGSSLLLSFEDLEGTLGVLSSDAGDGLARSTVDFGVSALLSSDGVQSLDLIESVSWAFGDGATGAGLEASHTYANAGRYEAVATITLANGDLVVATRMVEVESVWALAAPLNGEVLNAAAPEDTVKIGENVVFEETGDGEALKLNGDVVSYETDATFFNNSEYTLLVDFHTGEDGSGAGRILNLSGSFVVEVSSEDVLAYVMTDQGTATFRIDDLDLGDNAWHQLAVRFSGVTGVIELLIDGEAIAAVDGYDGARQPEGSNDLHIGNPWGDGFSGWIRDLEFIRGALSDEALGEERDFGDAMPVPMPVVQQETPAVEPEPVEEVEAEQTVVVTAEAPVKIALTTPPTVNIDFDALGVDLSDGGAVHMNGDVQVVTAGASGVTDLGRLDQIDQATSLTIALAVSLPDAASDDSVRLFWNHKRFGIELDGETIDARYMTDDGDFVTVSSGPLDLPFGEQTVVALVLDEETDTVTLAIDDVVVAEVEQASVVVAAESNWSATVGGRKNGPVFEGEIENLVIVEEAVDASTTSSLIVASQPVGDADDGQQAPDEVLEISTADAMLYGDATGTASAFSFDGDGDFAQVEGLDPVAEDSALSVSFDFKRDVDGADEYARLLWNKKNYGVELDGDDLSVVVYDEDGKLQRFTAKDVDLGDDWNELTVALDSAAGEVVATLNDEAIIDVNGFGLDYATQDETTVNIGGSATRHNFDGEIANIVIEETYDTVL